MVKIDDPGELAEKYDEMAGLGVEAMVQELIPGSDAEGVNYNSYAVDGVPVAEFTARKRRLEPPFFGSPRVIVSAAVPEIIEFGRALLGELKYTGFSCMEFKRDVRDGQYKLMELNCRSNRSGSLAVACGMNFPWIMYRHMVHGDVVKCEGFKENVAWIEGTSDLIRFVTSRKEERYTLKEYVAPYLLERVFGAFTLDDPMPFLRRTQHIASLSLKALFGRWNGRN